MLVDTGYQDGSGPTHQLARLCVLFSAVIASIQKGTCSVHMVETLFRVLELFNDGRLGCVVLIGAGQREALPGDWRELLSVKIVDLALSQRTKTYLLNSGVWYVGEAYRWINRPGRGKRLEAVVELKDALPGLGLPPQLNPIEAGWRPPYWDDSRVIKALNAQLLGAVRHRHHAEMLQRRGVHCLGQLIAHRRQPLYNPKSMQRALTDHMCEIGVHAGMFLPPNWTPPSRPPSSWCKRVAERKRSESRQQEEKAWMETALQRSVESLELSARSGMVLKNGQVVYVGELVQLRETDLLQMKCVGRRMLKEIKRALADLGLTLGVDPRDQMIAEFNARRKV